MIEDKPQDASPELTLAERRQRLANALGFLLARAWLREHGSTGPGRLAPAEAGRRQPGPAEKPP